MAAVLNVFAAWKSLIDQATTNDEKPTPGYLYNEIASACLHLLPFLLCVLPLR